MTRKPTDTRHGLTRVGGEDELPPRRVTVKQERFVAEFLSCGDATRAYLVAYDTTAKSGARWVVTEAHRLLRHPAVQERLSEVRARSACVAAFSADEAFREAGEALELARKLGNPAAMVSAVALRAKLAGVLVERQQVTRGRSERDLSDEELERELQRAALEAGYEIRPLRSE